MPARSVLAGTSGLMEYYPIVLLMSNFTKTVLILEDSRASVCMFIFPMWATQ